MSDADSTSTAAIVAVLERLGEQLTGATADKAPLDRLIATLEAHTAVAAGLTATLARNAEAMFAVADSHAKLLAALLMPDDSPAPDEPESERERTMRLAQVLAGDGSAIDTQQG